MKKPACKLPEMAVSSHLIGLTISSLKNAGQTHEMNEFVSTILVNQMDLEYDDILQIAKKYVSFKA